jgi:hypothetical protein
MHGAGPWGHRPRCGAEAPITGKLTHLLKSKAGVTVKATFTVWVDGVFSNVKPLAGEATASGFGATTAEEALRAVT